MATTYNRSNQDDFGGMLALAKNIDGGTVAKVMSRFGEELEEDDSAVQNFDQINMDLTKLYSTKNAKHNSAGADKLSIHFAYDWDLSNNSNASRGSFDRYIWAGQFEDKGGTAGTVFTNSNINGINTDGMMMVPSPYMNFTDDSAKVWAEDNFESIRLKIKSNGGIPANTFVPLFGYVYTHSNNPQSFQNSAGTAYRSQNWFTTKSGGNNGHRHVENGMVYDARIPNAISASQENLYQWSNINGRDDGSYTYDPELYLDYHDYARNTILWFLYAHDGAGNGMIVTCAGEAPASEHINDTLIDSYYRYRPTNGHFGNKDGYLEFKQPHYLNDWLNEQNKTLAELYAEWGDGGAGRNSFDINDPRRASSIVRPIYTHSHDMYDESIGGDKNNTVPDLDQSASAQTNVPNSVWSLEDYVYNAHSNQLNKAAHHYNPSYNQWSSNGNVIDSSKPSLKGFGAVNRTPFQIVAYGATSNSDLSTATEMLINVNTIGASASAGHTFHNHLSVMGLDSSITHSNASAYGHGSARQMLYTAKILDFNFRDVPGQMFHDYYRLMHNYQNLNTQDTYQGPKAIALRPTTVGDMQIESFSYSNYTNDDPLEIIGGNSLLKDYYRSSSSTSYLFGGGGHSYDPIKGAKASPSTELTDSNSKWTDEENLINGDVTSRAELSEAGHENALYIQLNGLDGSITLPSPDSDFDIASMGITIRGITLNGVDYHKLRFAIVNQTNTSGQIVFFETVTSAQLEQQDKLDIGDIPIDNTSISPSADGAYHIQFQTTLADNHTYDLIKTAYLKIWAEAS